MVDYTQHEKVLQKRETYEYVGDYFTVHRNSGVSGRVLVCLVL